MEQAITEPWVGLRILTISTVFLRTQKEYQNLRTQKEYQMSSRYLLTRLYYDFPSSPLRIAQGEKH